MYSNDQLCFSCAKACGNCSWSSQLIPVDGWIAENTVLPSGIESFPSLSVQNTNLMDYVPDVYILTTNSQIRRCGIWFVKGMLKGMVTETVWVIEISIRL